MAYTDLCVDVDQFQGVVWQHITPVIDVVQRQLSTFPQIPITSSYIDWLNWNPYMTIPPAFGQMPSTSGYFNWLNWNPCMIIPPTFPQIPSTSGCFNWQNQDHYMTIPPAFGQIPPTSSYFDWLTGTLMWPIGPTAVVHVVQGQHL